MRPEPETEFRPPPGEPLRGLVAIRLNQRGGKAARDEERALVLGRRADRFLAEQGIYPKTRADKSAIRVVSREPTARSQTVRRSAPAKTQPAADSHLFEQRQRQALDERGSIVRRFPDAQIRVR